MKLFALTTIPLTPNLESASTRRQITGWMMSIGLGLIEVEISKYFHEINEYRGLP